MKYRIKSEYLGYSPIHLVDYLLNDRWVKLAAFRYREEAEDYIAKDPVAAQSMPV